jgi:hypothetical protein
MNRKILIIEIMFVSIFLFCISGCSSLIYIIHPKALQITSSEHSVDSQHIIVKVHFNSPVNTKTVVVGKTLILSTEKSYKETGQVIWSSDHKELVFKTDKTIPDLLGTKAFFKLTLIGTESYTGQGVVKNNAGKALDGNADGKPGGNYSYSRNINMGQNHLIKYVEICREMTR